MSTTRARSEEPMVEITDEFMREQLTRSRSYTLVILKDGPRRNADGAGAVVWEHGRRNFALRAGGTLAIVCPVPDDTDVDGIGIFNLDPDQTRAVMDDDPGVRAGIFTYEVHPCRSFPGDALPA